MELSKVNSWFKLDEMQHNIKKTKHLLIDTAQKLYHTEITTLELSIDNARLEESVGEKRLGVVIDSHLIRKLNSKICLPKRATVYLTIECRKMLFNALVEPILQYRCTVWGNCSFEMF